MKKLLPLLVLTACQFPQNVSMDTVRARAARVCEGYRQVGIMEPQNFAVYGHTCYWRSMLPPERMCVCSPYKDAK